MKQLVILGSTGSIGRNALDVVSAHADQFRVVALAAGRNMELLKRQIQACHPRLVAVLDEEHAAILRHSLDPFCSVEIVYGREGFCRAAAIPEATLVISAMVGAAGLEPTLAAIDAGKDVALANKETMVIAGKIVMQRAAARGVKILPVDSEHSAIYQCLEGNKAKHVKRIILTASGGPFFRWSREEMKDIKPEQALKHPNWSMGKKITIDSATMMNKGLEIIEARWLFDIPYEKISVIIHPQSVVHSMVEYVDGSIMAQLGPPDMRIPIAYALSYPERLSQQEPFLDLLSQRALSFYPPDEKKFPCLALAFRAGIEGGLLPAVMNAANEIAVEKYLEEKIGFMDIPRVVRAVMEKTSSGPLAPSVKELLAADWAARIETKNYIEELEHGR